MPPVCQAAHVSIAQPRIASAGPVEVERPERTMAIWNMAMPANAASIGMMRLVICGAASAKTMSIGTTTSTITQDNR